MVAAANPAQIVRQNQMLRLKISESCQCYDSSDRFLEGYQACYDSEGNLFKYVEYDRENPNGNVVVGTDWREVQKNTQTALVVAENILVAGLLAPLLFNDNDAKKCNKYLEERRAEIEYDVTSYRQQEKEYEELLDKARDLEGALKGGTYTEYEVNEKKKQISECLDEAARKKPSIW